MTAFSFGMHPVIVQFTGRLASNADRTVLPQSLKTHQIVSSVFFTWKALSPHHCRKKDLISRICSANSAIAPAGTPCH